MHINAVQIKVDDIGGNKGSVTLTVPDDEYVSALKAPKNSGVIPISFMGQLADENGNITYDFSNIGEAASAVYYSGEVGTPEATALGITVGATVITHPLMAGRQIEVERNLQPIPDKQRF
jgi:hypothetical protein